jgi:CubicO group peptidase (beta-lactamase class C family)
VIHSLIADFSNRSNGGDGWLQTLTFSPRSNRVRVQTYSPTLNRFETDPASDFVLPLGLGVVPFDGSRLNVPNEAVFHLSETEAGIVLNGAQDLVTDQVQQTTNAVNAEVADAANETQQGFVDAMTPTDIDSYIVSQMAKHGIKGIALAVTSGNEIIYLKGYGTAGADRLMTPQTPMYIGSQSKSFTGLAIAQLIEQGKVKLNEPVQTYIPSFRVADEGASRKITINHLLHHTSGLSEAGFTVVLPDNATNEEAVSALASAKLTAPIGTRFQYFNVGYDVLAVVVQNVSGMTYEDYIQKNIFDPLKMTHTYTDPERARADGLAQGYSRFFGFAVPQKQPHRVYEVGAGYIISTAEDMAHYAIAMNNAGEGVLQNGTSLLFAPVQGYGMGWFVEAGHIYHGGANETFKTYVDLYPKRGLGIVLLINQGYMLDHFISAEQIFNGVEAIVLGRTPPPLTEGWSVKYIGWALGLFVLALSALHVRNFLALRGWRERAQTWSVGKKIWEVAISFIIPTIILIVVFSQVKAFMGTRFNLTYQMIVMFRTLPDIATLMIIGSVADYVQGFIKLFWLVRGKARA